jgi:probable F420-dependent oxidoreductase
VKFCSSLFRVSTDDYLEIARTSDQYGWDTLMLSDHVLHPAKIQSKYPYDPSGERPWEASDDFPDTWVASGMMAAVTERLKFMQMVYILPLREPFSVAKALGTAARLSGYRVGLGFGLGWMKDEFELLGQSFENRGKRADEMVEVMRKLWTGEMVEHHGEFYDFGPMCMRPAADGEIPIMVGGNSKPARRRCARLSDGWAPAYLNHEQLRAGIDDILAMRREFGRDESLSVLYGTADPYDLDELKKLKELGITHCTVAPWATQHEPFPSLAKRVDAIKRFGDEVIAKLA